MLFERLRRIKKGEPFKTDPINAAISTTNFLGSQGVSGDLEEGPGGISAEGPRRIQARIVSAGTGAQAGYYSWHKIQGVPTGGWRDDPSETFSLSGLSTPAAGSRAAYEENANASVPVGRKVDLDWNEQAGQWRFSGDSC